ncbi:MAG: hypothetical protein AAF611_11940 [Bacteroidota bacterium]
MKKKKLNKLKLKKVSVSNLVGGAASEPDGGVAERKPFTWRCTGSVYCTYSCVDYSCFCGDPYTVA